MKWKASVLSMALFALHSSGSELWTDEGNYDISWYSSDKDTHYIENATQLAGLAYLVNKQHVTFLNNTVNLSGDIDLSGKNWTPIGNNVNGSAFYGVFNGNDHTISGMDIDCGKIAAYEYDGQSAYYIGLFGYIGWVDYYYTEPSLTNFKMIDCSIMMNESVEDWDVAYFGSVVGSASYSTEISDIVVSSIISYLPANLFTKIYGGGIVGEGHAVRCEFDGSIKAKSDGESYIGGIVGSGTATDCENNAAVSFEGVFCNIGGIMGKGSADGCLNNGNISLAGCGNSELGYGFSSYIGGVTADGTAINSCNTGSIDSNLYSPEVGSNGISIGGLCGSYYSGIAINSCNLGTITSLTHNAGMEIINGVWCGVNDYEKKLVNSYSSPAINGNGEVAYAGTDMEYYTNEYAKSDEFLMRLNEGAEELSKSSGEMARSWIKGPDGYPRPSGNKLYPVSIVSDYTSGYISMEIKNMWTGEIEGIVSMSKSCYYEGEEVVVTVTPASGYELNDVQLDYFDKAMNEQKYQYFKDLVDNSFSFTMVPAACHITARFTSIAGIDTVAEMEVEKVTVFTTDGILIYQGALSEAKLPTGAYVVKSPQSTKKLFVR